MGFCRLFKKGGLTEEEITEKTKKALSLNSNVESKKDEYNPDNVKNLLYPRDYVPNVPKGFRAKGF